MSYVSLPSFPSQPQGDKTTCKEKGSVERDREKEDDLGSCSDYELGVLFSIVASGEEGQESDCNTVCNVTNHCEILVGMVTVCHGVCSLTTGVVWIDDSANQLVALLPDKTHEKQGH